MTYFEAAYYCHRIGDWAGNGGILAEPINDLIQAILTIVATDLNMGNWWIGGREYSSEGEWRWESLQQPWEYTEWGMDKPSDQDNLNCLVLSAEFGYKWVDEKCEGRINYPIRPICQLL